MKNFVILTFLFSALLTGNSLFAQIPADQSINKVVSVMQLIQQYYVEETDNNEIAEAAINNMLKELDPHSVYIPKKKVQKMNEPLEGNFEGVGIRFNILDDTIYVVEAIPGGPSESVGIVAGDKIVSVDGEIVAGIGIENNGVIKRLRGEKGTEVDVEILRKGEKKLLEFTITRDKIPIYSVDASYMIDNKTGYIKISRFAAKTPQEFRQAIYKLKSNGLENLILDLQGNQGGYLNAAFQIADEFLDKDKLIVYTEGIKSPKYEYNATAYGSYEQGNLIVLVDQFSASASEIVSGAIQDWDRGLVIGRRTFGKGLVQKPFTLPDGSMVRLTVANYYTPSGRFIQKPYEDVETYYKDLNERFKSGELTEEGHYEYPDSLKFETNNGRIVYGGGGIMPDIFVPLDTSFSSDYYTKVFRKGLVNRYSLYYVDQYRDALSTIYTDIETFKLNFEADQDFLDEFIAFAEDKGIEKNDEDLKHSSYLLGLQLKALIGRNLFNQEAYYYIINDNNDVLKRALQIINDSKTTSYNILWTNE